MPKSTKPKTISEERIRTAIQEYLDDSDDFMEYDRFEVDFDTHYDCNDHHGLYGVPVLKIYGINRGRKTEIEII